MPHTDPIQVKYSGRDFDTLLDDMEFRLTSRFGDDYTDFATSTMGVILLDIVSYAMSQLSWYQDRRATEAFLETALQRSSVSRLTRPLGYQMRPSTSSTTGLSVTPDEAQSFEWRVYTGFQFSGPSGLKFEAMEDVVWDAGSTDTKTVLVREGTTKTVNATSTGTSNQEVRLPGAAIDGKYVVEGSIRVFIDGAEWTEIDFLEFEETDQFEVHYHEEPPVIRFGNGVAGNIPATGAEIRTTYVVNSGKRGNVASNSIVSTAGPLIQVFTAIPITVTNAAGATGGTDPEGLDEAKIKAPKFFATRGVAVTQADYESLALAFNDPQYGAISSAFAFVARTFIADFVGSGLVADVEEEVEVYQTDTEGFAATLQQNGIDLTTATDAITAELATLDVVLLQIQADAASILDNIVIIEKNDNIDRSEDVLAKQNGNTSGYTYNIAEIMAVLDNAIVEGAGSYQPDFIAIKDSLLNEWAPDITLAKDTWLPNYQAASESAAVAIRSAGEDIGVQYTSAASDGGSILLANLDIITETASVIVVADSLETTVASHRDAIAIAFGALKTHYDEVLNNDCKANLITVPILTVDGDGFYVGPSVGLQARVETSLQEVADVAHVVRVVDGTTALVRVSPSVELTILEAAVFSEVASDIDTELRNLLKARRFSVSLFLSTAYELIEEVEGIDTFDVTFAVDNTDLPALVGLDSRGNVLVDDGHVITLGTITITEKIS
jgi:hypothetical protein